MIIRMPSPALRKRIKAIGDEPLVVREASRWQQTSDVLHHDGSELSEPERIRVLGLLAADDAEPFK
jgi:hypothetical protein